MINKRRIIISSFVTVLAVSAVGVSVASANMVERREKVQSAIRNNDFKAFQATTKDGPISKQINNKKDFEAIRLAHKLRKEGKFKEAKGVLEYAGIEHPGKKEIRRKRNADVRGAIDSGSWVEFQSATEGKNIAKQVNTQEKFELLIEAHELRKDGRHDEARKIMNELGLKGQRI